MSPSAVSHTEFDKLKFNLHQLVTHLKPLYTQAMESANEEGDASTSNSSSSSSPSPPTSILPPPAPAKTPIPTPAPILAPTPIPAPTLQPTPVVPITTFTADPIHHPALASLSPLAPGVWEHYKSIHKRVSSVAVTGGISFLTSSNVGLSKEEKATVALMHNAFKIFKVVLQMTTSAAEIFPEAANAFEDISVAALAGMRTQLRARDQAWMRKALPAEALPAWHGLESSTLNAAEQDRFFTTMKYAAYKNQVQKPQWRDKKAPGKPHQQQHQPSKGKWPKTAASNSSTSSGLGTGNSAPCH